jgi:hypothetical protein
MAHRWARSSQWGAAKAARADNEGQGEQKSTRAGNERLSLATTSGTTASDGGERRIERHLERW